MRKPRRMQVLELVGVLGVGCWIASGVLWEYYAFHRPRMSQPEQGRTYPLITHGSVAYLTPGEHYFLNGLMGAGIVGLATIVLLYLVQRRRKS